MKSEPRDPKQPILQISDWKRVVVYALVMTASVLGVYWYATDQLGLSAEEGNTITFYALSLAQLLHVFTLYSGKLRFFSNEITRNKFIWMALILCMLIMLLTNYVPFLRQILSLQKLDLQALELILAAGFVPLLVNQVLRALFTLK